MVFISIIIYTVNHVKLIAWLVPRANQIVSHVNQIGLANYVNVSKDILKNMFKHVNHVITNV